MLILVGCEVKLEDLDLSDDVIRVIESTHMDLEYEVSVNFYLGEEAVLNALPEDCSPGGDDDWELEVYDPLAIACEIAEEVNGLMTVEELYKLVNELVKNIEATLSSDDFDRRVRDKGNEANSEEPDPRDDDDFDENMFSHIDEEL